MYLTYVYSSGEEFNVSYVDSSSEELNSEQYIVEKVVGKKIFKGELHYRIKWKDYPVEENTWEPLRNCTGALSLIREFEERVRQKRSRSVGSVGGRKPKNGTSNRGAASRRKTDVGELRKEFTGLTITLENATSQNIVKLDKEFFPGESSENLFEELRESGKKRLKNLSSDFRCDVSKPTATVASPIYEMDCNNENLPEPNTCRNISNDLDTTLTSQFSVNGAVNSDRMVCSITATNNSKGKSILRKYSASEIEIVGAEPTDKGVTIGVRVKDQQDVIRFDSREVTDLWPQLYVSFLEKHIVFEEK